MSPSYEAGSPSDECNPPSDECGSLSDECSSSSGACGLLSDECSALGGENRSLIIGDHRLFVELDHPDTVFAYLFGEYPQRFDSQRHLSGE